MNNLVPKYLEMGSFATVAICGQSGSGKTSTIRFIIAQMILNNVQTIVCDPHGNAGNGSLKDGIAPLEHLLALPVAVTLEDRISAFRMVHTILRNRIAGKDTSTQKICIILDEATLHFLECDKEQSQEFTRFLMDLSNEGRKKDICCFLLGQSWKADFVGSRTVRSAITHVLFHRSNEAEIKLFVESMPAKERRKISTLPTGSMFVYPYLYTVKVPYISKDDLIDFASKFKRAISDTINSTPIPVYSSVQTSVQEGLEHTIAKRANVQDTQNQDKTRINTNIARAIKDILQSRNEGNTKEQTILKVLKIKKSGSSERWKIASRFYDKVLERAKK